MKTKLLTVIVFLGISLFAQVSVGIRIGPPPRPQVIAVQPASPGPGYYRVDGYQYPVGNHYKWHAGYWTRPPYEGAQWVGPRYESGMFYEGSWAGDHGKVNHDHHSDRDHDRDYRRQDHDRR